ncbi:MAG: UvrD-helicase domain-containing protein [Clostridia bacterium]|nr:UvrD-helicase domain-containing protein [Clostridia bacterium]
MTPELEKRFCAARREIIRQQFSKLNPEQQRACMTTEGPLLLLAGAGSGKTTVLIHRIANLLQFGAGSDTTEIPDGLDEEDVLFLEQFIKLPTEADKPRAFNLCAWERPAPWNLIAITFTNKAANELKDRLTAKLGPEGNDVWAMTFHSACCRILRKDIDRLGYNSDFTIYDTSDSERVMKECIRDMNLDDKVFAPKLVLSIISRAKDKLQDPMEFSKEAKLSGDFRMEKIARLYQEYQARLKDANAVDFDDIILLTVRLLQENDDVRDYYQRKFRYVLIDEYQDTNHLQYLLAGLLAGRYENICVVGDDDQSIYRFRGATIENILSFEKQYQGAKVIRLEQNYRSTQTILNAANVVISNNKGRKGKRLWTQNGVGDEITVYHAMNESDEANYVANRVFTVGKGKDFHDFAVLYRTNAQSNALEYACKRNGIPYRIIGGTRFFDRAEVKDMLAYLCVINNHSDNLRLNRIINNPPRGIGAKALEMAQRQAEAANLPLYEVISNAKDYPALEKAAAKFMAFTDLIKGCEKLLQELSLPEFYEELMIRTGYVAMLESKDSVENRTRLENIRELKSSFISYMENNDAPTLNGFLEEIALYTDIEQYDADADAIVMMTMHSAKGLEFPHVFVVGMEEGLFPSSRSIGENDEMEEERRLCYVALTRAKKTLTLCCAEQRMLYGHTQVSRPSRFLEEIPDELVKHVGKTRESTMSAYDSPRGTYKTPTNYSRYDQSSTIDTFAPKPRTPRQTFSAPAAPKTERPDFQKGDMVLHKAFGRGMILSVMKMGNDAFLEIAFDNVGTKRLMANSAAQYMKKV